MIVIEIFLFLQKIVRKLANLRLLFFTFLAELFIFTRSGAQLEPKEHQYYRFLFWVSLMATLFLVWEGRNRVMTHFASRPRSEDAEHNMRSNRLIFVKSNVT